MNQIDEIKWSKIQIKTIPGGEIKRDQFIKECDLRWDLARKQTVGEVETI